ASLHQVARPADKFFASFRFGPGSEMFVGVEAHDDRVLSVAARRENDVSAQITREAADGAQIFLGPSSYRRSAPRLMTCVTMNAVGSLRSAAVLTGLPISFKPFLYVLEDI